MARDLPMSLCTLNSVQLAATPSVHGLSPIQIVYPAHSTSATALERSHHCMQVIVPYPSPTYRVQPPRTPHSPEERAELQAGRHLPARSHPPHPSSPQPPLQRLSKQPQLDISAVWERWLLTLRCPDELTSKPSRMPNMKPLRRRLARGACPCVAAIHPYHLPFCAERPGTITIRHCCALLTDVASRLHAAQPYDRWWEPTRAQMKCLSLHTCSCFQAPMPPAPYACVLHAAPCLTICDARTRSPS